MQVDQNLLKALLGALFFGFSKYFGTPWTIQGTEKRNATGVSTEAHKTYPESRQTGDDVIVQLFEWRWEDIADECANFLPQHGYTALQTSPVTEHILLSRLEKDSWSERYQPMSYKIITRSGNETDFRNMVKVCNEHKIKVYVDVVLNHMSERKIRALSIGGSELRPWTMEYPDVPYNQLDFHSPCDINDWNNALQVRNCMLEGRLDLDQTRENVRDRIVEFLNKLIDIGVAGFRVSDAKHIDVEDLAAIYSRVNDLNTTYFPAESRPYIYHEVLPTFKGYWSYQLDRKRGVKEAIPPSAYLKLGPVEDYMYSHELSQAFRREKALSLFKTSDPSWELPNWNKSVVFVDNHKTQRGLHTDKILSYHDEKWYKMAVGFMLSWPHSVARVMSSFKFGKIELTDESRYADEINIYQGAPSGRVNCSSSDWICEHRWRQIYNMVHFRKTVFGSEVSDWWSKGYQIAFCRKGKGFVAFNLEKHFHLNTTLQTSLPSGTYCDVISGSKISNNSCSGKTVRVNGDGHADITLRHDEEDGILAIHIGAKLG